MLNSCLSQKPHLKAMLHDTFFLATCNATMTNKKPFKLQRGCHTFATFSQLTTRTITNKMADVLSKRKMSSDWPVLTKLRCKLLRGCYTQATCLTTLRKVLLFLQLATQQLQLQNGVLRVNFFLQLATQRLLRCKLQEKLLRVTWPLVKNIFWTNFALKRCTLTLRHIGIT